MQKEINNILFENRNCACAYIDNFIYNAKSFDNLFFKLHISFKIFVAYRILIKPTKSFLNYLDMGLLGQCIDFLGFTTTTKKL